MDTFRGTFGSEDAAGRQAIDEMPDYHGSNHDDEGTDQPVRELPPEAIGQDERRMQVRAYNHWASLLGDRTYPSIEDLEPADIPDFGPNSVLLDFSVGIEDPIVQFLGNKLGEECEAPLPIERLSDVPPRSLLSRITDHYMQIMANEAPIGFEAEFVNQHGSPVMYRGILLPFSSDDESIDFIYGVINWKEMADAATSGELLLEMDQALDIEPAMEDEVVAPKARSGEAIADWADSPAHETSEEFEISQDEPVLDEHDDDENVADFAPLTMAPREGFVSDQSDMPDMPMPDFGQYSLDHPEDEDEEEEDGPSYSFASLSDYIEPPVKKAIDLEAEHFDPANYQVEGNELDGFDDAQDTPIPTAYEPVEDPYTDPVSEPVSDWMPVQEPELEAPAEPEAQTDTAFEAEAEAVSPSASLERFGRLSHDSVPPSDGSIAEPTGFAPFEDDAQDSEQAQDSQGADESPVEVAAFPSNTDIHDCLASARELANTANASEDRSRHALYAAVSRAYEFSLAAKKAPAAYDALLTQSGLSVQERAPMTPIVKLVFGSQYDKTRLTEYAAVLSHAHRIGLEGDALASFLAEADGGLKGVVNAERRLRREESGKSVEPEGVLREALAQKLRELEALALEADGPEFALVMIRRSGEEDFDVIGDFSDDITMIERAARKLVG